MYEYGLSVYIQCFRKWMGR